MAVIFGFFKEMLVAFYNDVSFIKMDQLEILNFIKGKNKEFDNIILIFKFFLTPQQVTVKNLSHFMNKIEIQIEKYLNRLYVFKNHDIFLMDQPIFNYIKSLILEVNHQTKDVKLATDFIVDNLQHKKNLKRFSIKLSNCVLNDKDMKKIIKSFHNFKDLMCVFLDFSNNAISNSSIRELLKVIGDKDLIEFEIWLNNTNVDQEGFDLLMDYLNSSKQHQRMKVFGFEFMQKNSLDQINFKKLSKVLPLKTELEILKLNFAYYDIDLTNWKLFTGILRKL